MSRQDRRADFRADFAESLTRWMDDHEVTTIELGRMSGVNRETIADAAQNRRRVRPETIERIRAAMSEIEIRRKGASNAEPISRNSAMVVTIAHPDHAGIVAALSAGTVVVVGADVQVWECRRIK
jgi:predicted transcriptional regulator